MNFPKWITTPNFVAQKMWCNVGNRLVLRPSDVDLSWSFSVFFSFSFLFYFSFSFQKCHYRWAENVMFATEPQLNSVIHAEVTFVFVFVFRPKNGISCSSAFSFTAENEKCIFSRRLYQNFPDYTLRQ